MKSLAQKNSTVYEYKIQFINKSNIDSNIALIGKKIYDNQKNIKKSVTWGPEIIDSCTTNWLYDNHHQPIEEKTICTDSGTVSLLTYQYKYGNDNKITQESFTRYKPYLELSITDHFKDSIVKKTYLNKKNLSLGIFEDKYIDRFNNLGKPSFRIHINGEGDTLMSKSYLYFPLSDTLRVRAKVNGVKGISEIHYLNKFNKEEIIDYCENGKLQGNTIRKYNMFKQLVSEQYFNNSSSRVISTVNYSYDSFGNMLRKVTSNLKDEKTIVYKYKGGNIIREDYFFGNILDHSILYKYRSSISNIKLQTRPM